MRKTLFPKLNLSVVTGLGLLLTVSLSAQTMTNEQMLQILQQAAMSQNSTIDPSLINSPRVTTTTAPKTTSTAIKEEFLNFTPVVRDRTVKLNDIVPFYLRSYAAATTPIEIYLLAFNSSNMPVKKIFIKNVFNEKVGVTKKYKLMITEGILNSSPNAAYIQVGYCIGGCKASKSKLIKGKIILPRIQPLSSDNSAI